MSFDYHQINEQYERMLEDEWEKYNEEGEQEEYDPYAEGERLWEFYNER